MGYLQCNHGIIGRAQFVVVGQSRFASVGKNDFPLKALVEAYEEVLSLGLR